MSRVEHRLLDPVGESDRRMVLRWYAEYQQDSGWTPPPGEVTDSWCHQRRVEQGHFWACDDLVMGDVDKEGQRRWQGWQHLQSPRIPDPTPFAVLYLRGRFGLLAFPKESRRLSGVVVAHGPPSTAFAALRAGIRDKYHVARCLRKGRRIWRRRVMRASNEMRHPLRTAAGIIGWPALVEYRQEEKDGRWRRIELDEFPAPHEQEALKALVHARLVTASNDGTGVGDGLMSGYSLTPAGWLMSLPPVWLAVVLAVVSAPGLQVLVPPLVDFVCWFWGLVS